MKGMPSTNQLMWMLAAGVAGAYVYETWVKKWIA